MGITIGAVSLHGLFFMPDDLLYSLSGNRCFVLLLLTVCPDPVRIFKKKETVFRRWKHFKMFCGKSESFSQFINTDNGVSQFITLTGLLCRAALEGEAVL
jgi:hypothetical protein